MKLFCTLKEDIKTVFSKDPAARNILEVVFLYPGLRALWSHRFAHYLWNHKLKFLARLLSELSRLFNGIEIHPGAGIGRRFFIDHGMGVVIGETAIIKDDVLLYQGVVLGGTSLEKKKRHPTLCNNVVVGAAAVLLGPITIGDSARVGANSVIVKSVPPGVTVVGVPGRAAGEQREMHDVLEHGHLPDPVSKMMRMLVEENTYIETRLKNLEDATGLTATGSNVSEEIKLANITFNEGGGI